MRKTIKVKIIEASFWDNLPQHIKDEINGIISRKPKEMVEVVRCKYCKYHGATIEEQPTSSIMCAHMHDNDYCSYGKRKEDEI